MGRKREKPRDPFQWFLRSEAKAYKDSQQDGRPRHGVIWFAVDLFGHVALLHSRESGNVPLRVFANTLDEHLNLFEHFVRPSEEQMTGDLEVDSSKQGLYFYNIVEFGTMDGYD
jgi:hypothetical protein